MLIAYIFEATQTVDGAMQTSTETFRNLKSAGRNTVGPSVGSHHESCLVAPAGFFNGRKAMTDAQEKWVEIFATPKPETAEDIREYVKRLNVWFAIIHMGVLNVNV